jgi:negative regulator of sigma E activity
MTVHEQISSFIDNELNHEQEQDFLISLASNDATRKTFRSELVLKNIIHRDEVLTSPSRDLRPAVLATIGLGIAATAGAETADAATAATAAKSSALKALFATKLNALVTSSMIVASALGGYGVHSYIASNAAAPVSKQPIVNTTHVAPVSTPTTIELQAPEASSTPADLGSAPAHSTAAKVTGKKPAATPGQAQTTDRITTVGSAPVNLDLPNKKNK